MANKRYNSLHYLPRLCRPKMSDTRNLNRFDGGGHKSYSGRHKKHSKTPVESSFSQLGLVLLNLFLPESSIKHLESGLA